jgi:hypothetical protein
MPGLNELNGLLLKDVVKSFNIDAVLIADFLTYQLDKHAFGIDESLVSLDIPTIYFDLYGRSHVGYVVDTLGREPIVLQPELFGSYPVLRPCPFANIKVDTEEVGSAFRYGFLPEPIMLAKKQKTHIRDALGPIGERKMLFLTTAPWQHRMMRNWVGRSPLTALFRALVPLAGSIVLVHIGPEPFSAAELEDKIEYKWIPPSAPDQFNVILAASDLFISLNAIASTMARATVYGVPSLLLMNSTRTERDGVSSDIELLGEVKGGGIETGAKLGHPGQFLMWPLGWFGFLSATFFDNQYFETFERVEVYDSVALTHALEISVSNPLGRAAAREDYLWKVRSLPAPEDVIHNLSSVLFL